MPGDSVTPCHYLKQIVVIDEIIVFPDAAIRKQIAGTGLPDLIGKLSNQDSKIVHNSFDFTSVLNGCLTKRGKSGYYHYQLNAEQCNGFNMLIA